MLINLPNGAMLILESTQGYCYFREDLAEHFVFCSTCGRDVPLTNYEKQTCYCGQTLFTIPDPEKGELR